MVPASIHQVKTAKGGPDSTVEIDGKAVGQVILMGVVRSVDQRATSFKFLIEDHTGSGNPRVLCGEEGGGG